MDVDSNTNYEHFKSKFTKFGYKRTKEKIFKYGDNKEYKLFKFEKEEGGNKKVFYGIKAEGIEDDFAKQDVLMQFLHHLNERHLNRHNSKQNTDKYNTVAFNCASGISRSVMGAVHASLSHSHPTTAEERRNLIKDVVKNRHKDLDNTTDTIIEKDGMLRLNRLFRTIKYSIIMCLDFYSGHNDKLQVNYTAIQDHLSIEQCLPVHVSINRTLNTKKDVATLVSRYTNDFLTKQDKPFNERMEALSKIYNEGKDLNLNTAINRLNKDTWFEGLEKSLKDLSHDKLERMFNALSSDKDLNEIFKSSTRLNALREAGETEQLARLKERAKKACEAKLGIIMF